jgi:hypothetical protein
MNGYGLKNKDERMKIKSRAGNGPAYRFQEGNIIKTLDVMAL